MADIGNTVFDPWEYTGWIDGSFKGLDISGNGEDTITFWWYGSIEAQPSTLYVAIYEGHSADATNMDLTLCQGSETYSVVDTVPAWHSFTMPSVTLVNGADYYLVVQASAGESLELWNANRFATHSGYSEWHDSGYPWPDPLIADSPVRTPCIYIETEAAAPSSVATSGDVNLPQITVGGAALATYSTSGAVDLPALSIAGLSAWTTEVETIGGFDLPQITVGGAALATYSTSGAVDLPLIAVGGAVLTSYDASGSATLPQLSVSGSAATFLGVGSSGEVILPALTVSGAALTSYSSSGAFDLPSITINGLSDTTYLSSGSFSLPSILVDGTALAAATGEAIGAVTLPGLSVGGLALQEFITSGSIVMPLATVSGTVLAQGDVTLEDLQDQITALQATVGDLYIRMDLNPLVPNTYAADGSWISNSVFTLTKVDAGQGDGSFIIVREDA